jgi:hypothetical protein
VLASVRSRSVCAELADQTKEWIPMRDIIVSGSAQHRPQRWNRCQDKKCDRVAPAARR